MERSDRAWNLWVAAILAGVIVTSFALAFVVVPIVHGRYAGLDAFTAICRALGINIGAQAPAVSAGLPPTTVAWTASQFTALAKADKSAGEALAQTSCIACHAADGSAPDPSIPRMAGQFEFAIFKELQDFKSGARASEVMAPLVKDLDDKQMADVAAYYSKLVRHDIDAAHPSFAGPEIEDLALRGDPARALPPCSACHAVSSGGPIETPTLTGQSPEYVAAQLTAFANGARHNDIFARMRAIASKLTPYEMALLGDYYRTPH